MNLKDILYKVAIRAVKGNTNLAISAIAIDSRSITPGSCFIAVRGVISDGHNYIDEAVKKGAVAIVCERMPDIIHENICYVEVDNSESATGYISHNFCGEPSRKLKLVGVTGTNGKTTVITTSLSFPDGSP